MVKILGIDVGTVRIGVASADTVVPVAMPLRTVMVDDGKEVKEIRRLVLEEGVETVVVGYPRNQSGEPTAQTEVSKQFAMQLEDIVKIVFQDESLTSVMAEERLKKSNKPYQKADIDALAAAIILQDYMEANYG